MRATSRAMDTDIQSYINLLEFQISFLERVLLHEESRASVLCHIDVMRGMRSLVRPYYTQHTQPSPHVSRSTLE